jgi:hypothetical protein
MFGKLIALRFISWLWWTRFPSAQSFDRCGYDSCSPAILGTIPPNRQVRSRFGEADRCGYIPPLPCCAARRIRRRRREGVWLSQQLVSPTGADEDHPRPAGRGVGGRGVEEGALEEGANGAGGVRPPPPVTAHRGCLGAGTVVLRLVVCSGRRQHSGQAAQGRGSRRTRMEASVTEMTAPACSSCS